MKLKYRTKQICLMVFMALLIIGVSFSTKVFAEKPETPAEYFTYVVNTFDNGCTIIGYDNETYPDLTDIVIPASLDGHPVTAIGNNAFDGASTIESMFLPATIESIGDYVFEDCGALVNVDSNNEHYKSINGVLYDKSGETLLHCPCSAQGEFYIPDGVTSIGDRAFAVCVGLTQVFIPDSVRTIGSESFDHCNGLTQVVIPEGVTSINENGIGAFAHCLGLTEVTIPSSVESIGYAAFYECSALVKVTISEEVTSIGDSVFWDCTSLTDIVIPSTVTSIGYGAFHGCSSLTNMTIPASVIVIGSGAFDGCQNLTLTVVENSAAYQYAEANNIPCKLISENPETPSKLICSLNERQ